MREQRSIVKQARAVELSSDYFTLTPTGLVVDGNPTYQEWEQYGIVLGRVEGAVHWWIGDWVNMGEAKYGEKYAQALEATGFAFGTLRDDAWVARQYTMSDRSDILPWSHHRVVADMESGARQQLLHKAEAEGWTKRQLREAKKALLPAPQMPEGKYRVVYADPPWKYGDKLIEGYGAAEHHYPAMSIDELCKMNIVGQMAPDAVLFLWVTSPLLKECWPVIEAWGFEYRTSFVWDKVKHNYGHYNSARHELLLICARGSCLPDTKKLYDSVQTIERTEKHSEKPDEFRAIIDALYTHGPKIELFARTAARPGWTVWGNEVE